ncbi:MAG TPA: hypothetical protein VFC73_01175 [Syntrophomonadaceae bacterium]|nr:hypothetical protein [Syntrophomonadaceae bacterium]
MTIRLVTSSAFSEGDLVNVKTMAKNKHFCIIGFKNNDRNEQTAILKALFNEIYIIEKPVSELTSLLIKDRL